MPHRRFCLLQVDNESILYVKVSVSNNPKCKRLIIDLNLKEKKIMKKKYRIFLLAFLEMISQHFQYSVIFLSYVFSVVFPISFHYTISLLQSEIMKFEINFTCGILYNVLTLLTSGLHQVDTENLQAISSCKLYLIYGNSFF